MLITFLSFTFLLPWQRYRHPCVEQIVIGEFPCFRGKSVYSKGSPLSTRTICKTLQIYFACGLVRNGLDVEETGLGMWQRNRATLEGRMYVRCEKNEPASRGDACFRGRKGDFHIVHGSKGDCFELPGWGKGFGAGSPDFYVREVESANGFAEEARFFVLRFGEGDLDIGAQQGDREAGKAGSGAEVEKSSSFFGEMGGGEEAFAEVPADYLFGVPDGGEIGAGVPFEEKVEVSGELGKEAGGGFGEIRGY
jgi:hypothetical protein